MKKIVRLVGSITIFTAIFWLVPFEECARSLMSVKPGYFAAGILLSLLGAAVETNQLWLLFKRRGLPVGFRAIVEAKMVSRFYGQFMAGELTGSVVKLYRLAGPTNQWAEVGAAMVFVRLVNTITLVLMGLVFVLIDRPDGAGQWIGLALLVMALGLLGLQWVLVRGVPEIPRSLQLRGGLVERMAVRLRAHGERATESYRLYGNSAWVILLHALMRHTIALASFACLALSLDIHLSLLTIGWIRVVLQAVMMLPISISGLGLREGTLVLLLQDYGVAASSAVALALLVFVGKLIKNSIGGLIEGRSMWLSARTAR